MTTNDYVILLVENDPNDVILIQRALHKSKILNPLQVVVDGEKAIQYLAGEAPYTDRSSYPLPVLVMLDLNLPRKSGFEVLKWAKQNNLLPQIPFVVLTSSNQGSDVERAYDLGANFYLVKPVDHEDLFLLLRTLGLHWMIFNKKPDFS